MENRFEHTPPEEQQGWGAYATPPSYPGQQHNPLSGASSTLGLCLRVREILPNLLENDGAIRPEMATAVYGHLAVCADCALEFDLMRRLVKMVEAVGPAEMPMDFSGLIMRRIETEFAAADVPRKETASRPFSADVSASPGHAPANHEKRGRTELRGVAVTHSVEHTETPTIVEQEALTHTRIRSSERLTLAACLATVASLFVLTEGGRRMLGANLAGIFSWLGQVGDALGRLPVLGVLFTAIVSALAQIGALLGSAYNSLGTTAARGFAVDIGLCFTAYYFLVARKQRGQITGT